MLILKVMDYVLSLLFVLAAGWLTLINMGTFHPSSNFFYLVFLLTGVAGIVSCLLSLFMETKKMFAILRITGLALTGTYLFIQVCFLAGQLENDPVTAPLAINIAFVWLSYMLLSWWRIVGKTPLPAGVAAVAGKRYIGDRLVIPFVVYYGLFCALEMYVLWDLVYSVNMFSLFALAALVPMIVAIKSHEPRRILLIRVGCIVIALLELLSIYNFRLNSFLFVFTITAAVRIFFPLVAVGMLYAIVSSRPVSHTGGV